MERKSTVGGEINGGVGEQIEDDLEGLENNAKVGLEDKEKVELEKKCWASWRGKKRWSWRMIGRERKLEEEWRRGRRKKY